MTDHTRHILTFIARKRITAGNPLHELKDISQPYGKKNQSLQRLLQGWKRYLLRRNIFKREWSWNAILLLRVFPSIGFGQDNPSKTPRTKSNSSQGLSQVHYVFMKYYSQGLNKPHFRPPCQMPKDYTWRGVYRFDSSSVVRMPFLKAP